MLHTLWQVSESTPAGWYSGTMTWWVILRGGWPCTRFYNTWSWNEETNFQVRTTEGFVVEKLERIYTAMAKVTNYLINHRYLTHDLLFSPSGDQTVQVRERQDGASHRLTGGKVVTTPHSPLLPLQAELEVVKSQERELGHMRPGGPSSGRQRLWALRIIEFEMKSTSSVIVNFSENQNLMCRSNNTLRALSFSSRTSNLIHPA